MTELLDTTDAVKLMLQLWPDLPLDLCDELIAFIPDASSYMMGFGLPASPESYRVYFRDGPMDVVDRPDMCICFDVNLDGNGKLVIKKTELCILENGQFGKKLHSRYIADDCNMVIRDHVMYGSDAKITSLHNTPITVYVRTLWISGHTTQELIHIRRPRVGMPKEPSRDYTFDLSFDVNNHIVTFCRYKDRYVNTHTMRVAMDGYHACETSCEEDPAQLRAESYDGRLIVNGKKTRWIVDGLAAHD